jgi:hypothetical protein
MEAELQRVDALLSLQGDDLLQALQAGRKLEEGKQPRLFGDPKATTYLDLDNYLYQISICI